MADLKNTMIGGFRILAEIKGASGSQGQIFKAVCERPPFAGIEAGTVVALKAMAVHDEDGQAWAKLEKRTSELVRLSHPNVVKYYGCFSEAGTFNDIHAIVQEFLDGETLKQRLLRCPSGLDADEALHVIEAALAGLEYTAANGIVHRDVKPGNIFLCADGGVKLIDFEVAHQEGGTTTSASGNLVGSFDYMAPDFTNSTFRGDERSDVFSMGVVMHEAITGRTPYQRIEGGDNQANFAFLSRWARLQIDGINPIRISSRANRLLAHSEEVLAKALAPLPQDRYASFAEFHAGLKAIRYRDLRNGEMVYRILQIVGKGGFGEVFKARQKRSNQLVAIKHLLKAAYAERFYREARIMSQLRDPCFVRFIDFFVVDHAGNNEAFLVMDFLPGMPGNSLRDAIKRAGGAALPLRDTLLAFARYAHGLSVIHSRGIFHRDIKPSNLYYPEGQPERAAIMDLGIARNIHGTATTGQVPGTLDYMPPEVVLTDNRGDSGMDIYALGLCLYEAVSGKTAYPRLPQGAAALTAFFTRAKIKAMPDLSDPAVVGNTPLHELLVRMTHPDSARRIVDTKAVECRLAELAEAAGAGVELPDMPADEEKDEQDPGTITFIVPSMDEVDPDAPENGEQGGRVTEATDGTLATEPEGEDGRAALEEEIKRVKQERQKRNARNLFIAMAIMAVVCGVVWAFRGMGVRWLQSRAASVARPEAERVVAVYADRGLEAGRTEKERWLARWTPGRGRWVDLDEASFAACTNNIRIAELVLLEREAKAAVDDVVAAFADVRETVESCEKRAAVWRTQWAVRCSPAKVAELERLIDIARNGRAEREHRVKWDKFRQAGRQTAEQYLNADNPLERCDERAEKWRKLCPEGFPQKDFKKLNGAIADARAERVRKDYGRVAEAELKEVLQVYSNGLNLGDGKAKSWREKWKGTLSESHLAQLEKRIDSAREKQEKIERRIRVEKKKKSVEETFRQIVATYRDDSSETSKADAQYDGWVKDWENDQDLADWLPAKKKEVDAEKKARKERDNKTKEGCLQDANVALEAVLRSYGNSDLGLDAVDKEAQKWRAEWRGRIGDADFGAFESRLVSARQKRVNHNDWEKTQQELAAATNAVESLRATLIKQYNDEAGKDKANIDGRFDGWVKKWENNEFLRKSLPGWFAVRKKTVEDAKAACEARIAEAKRIKFVAAKTNSVATVRAQLVNGYRKDASDKLKLDKAFTDWMLKWGADADLPAGWFDAQRQVVEREKTIREQRDANKARAREQANFVRKSYRTSGVDAGNTGRTMWRSNWTNVLDSATFNELSKVIDDARDEVVKNFVNDGFAKKTNEVVRARIELVTGYETVDVYANDVGVKKSGMDRQVEQWANAWETDADLRKLQPDWFAAQRRVVESARRACEARIATAVQEQRVNAKTNAVVSVRAALERDYADDSVKQTDVDGRFKRWVGDYENDEDLKAVLPNWFAGQKKLAENAKRARGERVRQRIDRIEAERKRFVERYKDDSSDKAKLDGDFKERAQNWRADGDLRPEWLDVQMRAVEKEKVAREERMLAREQAYLVCDMYRREGVAKGDGSRTFWIGNWTNKLDAAVFKELSGEIKKAYDERVRKDSADDAIRIENEKRARIEKKQKQAESEVGKLVSEYGNAAIARTETDGAFSRWRATWEADADLAVDWVTTHHGEIEKARTERIQRDVADQNRKDAYDAAALVCKGYASGVDAGDTERQLWDGKWKSVLGEKDYEEIIAIIDKARGSARAKAEVERRKAESEKLEKDVRALMEVDRDHVDQWRKRLEQAEQIIADGKPRGVLDGQKATELLNEINLRKKWVVGVVVNQSQHEIEVARRPIKPGQREFFEYQGTMPVGGLQVVCAGYKPLVIDGEALDCSEVSIGNGKWKLEPIPKAQVRIPQLENGVTCRLGGVVRGSGEQVEVDSGKVYEYVYSRKNHEDQKGGFSAKGGEHKELPPPKAWRVKPKFEEWCQAKLGDVEVSLGSGFGLSCLEIYHEMHVEGYRLDQDDLENVEKAWKRCDEDFKKAKEVAVVRGRYNLREAENVWMKARRLYNELTGKRLTVEDASR